MFDVGLWELVVLFVVGLLVLGPERLPKVAAQLGDWAGKTRRMARILTTQLQEEINAVDPRRIMDPPAAKRSNPEPAWNRPGVDDLKPGPAGTDADTAEPPGAESPSGPAQP